MSTARGDANGLLGYPPRRARTEQREYFVLLSCDTLAEAGLAGTYLGMPAFWRLPPCRLRRENGLDAGKQPLAGKRNWPDTAMVAGGFMAVRCVRQVQGGMIDSARTRPRPKADSRPAGLLA
jgi:hypothetical protein